MTVTSGGITFSAGGAIKGGQTAYNTGNGWFLGYSGGFYRFSIGDPGGSYMRWTGSELEIYGQLINNRPYSPGGFTEVACKEVNREYSSAAYIKHKEIQVPRGGTVTTFFTIEKVGSGNTVGWQIYKNGSPAGTLRSITTAGTYSFSENISVAAGDRIALHGRSLSGGSSLISLALEVRTDQPPSQAIVTYDPNI